MDMLIFRVRELRRAKYLVLILLIGLASVEAAAQSAPLRKDIPLIAKTAKGAIVTIIMAANDKPISQGTGFLVSADGVIVTNYHVIETGNVAVVKFPDDTAFPVDGVRAADKVRDLAIIKIHGKTFRTLALGDSDEIQVGEEVVAIGNPLSLESTVSNGIISGVRTSKEQGGRFLQTTAPISPGSSGGPLFNMRGEVVGINSMYLEGGENLNFAIPVNDAKLLLSNQSAKLQNLPNEHDVSLDAPKHSRPVPKSSPDLEKTLHWIQNTLNAGDGKKSFEFRDGTTHSQTYLMPELNGCQVTFVNEMRNETTEELRATIRWRVNLGDLDPTSLEADASGLVTVHTTDKVPSISMTIEGSTGAPVTDAEPRAGGERSLLLWVLSSQPSAERFVKALHGAITLCGGKASAF